VISTKKIFTLQLQQNHNPHIGKLKGKKKGVKFSFHKPFDCINSW